MLRTGPRLWLAVAAALGASHLPASPPTPAAAATSATSTAPAPSATSTAAIPIFSGASVSPYLSERVSPAPAGSAEPDWASGPDGGHYLTWLEKPDAGKPRLRFATTRDGARAWSEPRTIVEADSLLVNWADFPSVLPLDGGRLLAHFLDRRPGGKYAYDARYTISTDFGETWGPTATLHDDGTATEHGFVSLVALPGGRAAAAWLDGRAMAGGDGHGDAGHEAAGGDMSLRLAVLGLDGRIEHTLVLDDRACECCSTSAVAVPGGLLALYRDRSGTEVRDVGAVRVAIPDGGGPPSVLGRTAVHDDGWVMKGCPVNGPAADATLNFVAVAWYTEGGGKSRVRLAWSSDAGATFAAPLEVASGPVIGRADVVFLRRSFASADGNAEGRWPIALEALVTWIEDTPRGAFLRARRASANGEMGPAVDLVKTSSARRSGFPRLARPVPGHPGPLLAWTDPSEPARVRVAAIDVSGM